MTTKERNRRLRLIKKQILKEPRQFQMDDFFDERDSTGNFNVPNCGTAACIAGWAVCLFSRKKPLTPKEASCLSGPGSRGAKLLGVNLFDNSLFSQWDWPEPFCHAYFKARSAEAAARIAAQRIDHFIKTGE